MSTYSPSCQRNRSIPVLVHTDAHIIYELQQIYQKLTLLLTQSIDNNLQLNLTERQDIWWNTIQLWFELSKKIVDIPLNEQYLITGCLDVISTISSQWVDSKSVFDLNDYTFAEKTFSAYLTMLDLPHVTAFLCKVNILPNESSLLTNIQLILSAAMQSASFLTSNTADVLDQRTNLLILLKNYVEKRITSIELRSDPLIESILSLFWNISDKISLIPILVEMDLSESLLRWLSYSNKTSMYDQCEPIISIIYNISRHDEGADTLNRYEATEIVKDFRSKYVNMSKEEMSLLVPMILAHLTSPEQFKRDKKIMNDALNQLLQRIINSSDGTKLWRDCGFHVNEFLSVMVKLFVIEERTLDYILCHAETDPPSDVSSTIRLFSSLLIAFADALNKNNQLEQFTLIAILNILWSISFQTPYLQELLMNNQEAVRIVEILAETNEKKVIEQYKPRSMEGISEAACGILHNIEEYSENLSILNHIETINLNKKPSIMISYCHNDQLFCYKVLDCLSTEQKQFDIWIDQTHCQTPGDLWETIALGMEQANLIVCLISEYYFQSKSCRQEFIYATDTIHKSILPVFLGDFKPKGWLGIRIPGLKYIRIRNVDQPDQLQMNDILETILATLTSSSTSISSEYSSVELQPSPNQWSLESTNDIEHWFSHYHISKQLRDLYDFRTGQEMLQYGRKLIENEEKHMEIYSRAYTKKYDGDELLPHEFQRFVEAMKELLRSNRSFHE